MSKEFCIIPIKTLLLAVVKDFKLKKTMEKMMIYVPIILALIGLVYMLIKKSWVMKQDAGDGKMKEISNHIYEGALAFLKAEYRLLAFFVVGASIV